jgi:hypothetical protein
MPNVAVPMSGGETRWITEEERARIALKYGAPQRWKDPKRIGATNALFGESLPNAPISDIHNPFALLEGEQRATSAVGGWLQRRTTGRPPASRSDGAGRIT